MKEKFIEELLNPFQEKLDSIKQETANKEQKLDEAKKQQENLTAKKTELEKQVAAIQAMR